MIPYQAVDNLKVHSNTDFDYIWLKNSELKKYRQIEK